MYMHYIYIYVRMYNVIAAPALFFARYRQLHIVYMSMIYRVNIHLHVYIHVHCTDGVHTCTYI